MSLSTFLERYECILQTLDQIQTELLFDLKHRLEAAGLLSSIQTREFMATAFLFREVFAKTGPLSHWCLLPCTKLYDLRASKCQHGLCKSTCID